MDLRQDLLWAADPEAFAKAAGFHLDPWQIKVLRSVAQRLLLNCSRQVGKTRVAAIIGLRELLYQAGCLVLIIAPSLRQSRQCFAYIKQMLDTLNEVAAEVLEDTDVLNACELTLTNASKIVCLPAPVGGSGRTLRSFAKARLIIEDESAQLDDEVFHAITPMLDDNGGRMMMLSSPFGKRGHFWKAWSGEFDVKDSPVGSAGRWERHAATALDCPARHSADKLRAELQMKGRARFDQEYMCIFADSAGSVFAYDDVMAAFSPGVRAAVAPAESIPSALPPPTQAEVVAEAMRVAATPAVSPGPARPGQAGTVAPGWASMTKVPYPIDW